MHYAILKPNEFYYTTEKVLHIFTILVTMHGVWISNLIYCTYTISRWHVAASNGGCPLPLGSRPIPGLSYQLLTATAQRLNPSGYLTPMTCTA
jgi:hypothetical protein